MLIPVQAYLTRGVGVHREELVAFELALRDAGIAAQNLVTVSSILPPGCELISREDGEKNLQPGQILHVVLAREETADPETLLGAAIGIARPTDPALHGFIAEHGAIGESSQQIASHAEKLAIMMLASTLGMDVDEALETNEAARALAADGSIASHDAICAVADSDPEGRWTVVVAAAVFVMEWMRS